MQFLASLQIEPIDHADDGLRRPRTQRFQQGPQTVAAMPSLHQDHAGRITSETVEAMARQTTALARSMVRHHDHDFFLPPPLRHAQARTGWGRRNKSCQHRDDKTESDWERRLRCRDDLMECAAGKSAVRQVAIKCDKTKRKLGIQGLEPSWMARQQKAQFGQSGGSAFDRRRRRKCWQNKHLRLRLIE